MEYGKFELRLTLFIMGTGGLHAYLQSMKVVEKS